MDNQKIAKRLRELRESKQVSREIVANTVGIAVSTLAMYELGERIPRDEIKIQLARYYDTTVDALFFT